MSGIETKSIDITGEKSSFKRFVSPNIPYENVKVVGSNRIEVSFEILEVLTRKTYYIEKITFKNLDTDLMTTAENEIIKVDLRTNDNEKNIRLFIDCSEIENPGDYTKIISADLPTGYYIESIYPDKLKVKVKKK